MRMGGHSAMPISAQTPAARKNGRKPRLRIAAPRQARDRAAEARGERWEPDARVEMILIGEPRSLASPAQKVLAAHAFGSRRATGCRNARWSSAPISDAVG